VSKVRQIFACRACGAVQTKWMGKCPDCNVWDALEAQRVEAKSKVDPRASALQTWAAEEDADGSGGDALAPAHTPARKIAEIDTASIIRRIPTGLAEFDRVLGGGLVPGSAVLLGGDPGIGKSTLLLQAAAGLARGGRPTLYVSSEESAEQVKLRCQRLLAGEGDGEAVVAPDQLFLLAETSLARITEQAARVLGDRTGPGTPVLIVDSVQMIYKADLDAFPGSLTQLRRCCAELVYFAKASGMAVILVGHVTKDGQLAGPRMLEHLVDAVLYFEGDRYHAHRVVRAVKNRFGTTLEIGLFEMTGQGLREAPEGASVAALAEATPPRPGTVVCPVLTGSRCLMIEVQALTATGFLGSAKRKSSGLDGNRLAMLVAVLEQHAGLRLADRDIFASATSGVRAAEPAVDLALVLAIAGAHYRRALDATTAAVGEVGLGGEVRMVPQLAARLHEAKRLGYRRVLVPKTRGAATTQDGLELVPVANVDQAIAQLG